MALTTLLFCATETDNSIIHIGVLQVHQMSVKVCYPEFEGVKDMYSGCHQHTYLRDRPSQEE